MNFLVNLVGIFIVLVAIGLVRRFVIIRLLFKRGHNPYSRICKKCNSRQSFFQSNVEGRDEEYWWEEVGDGGTDENCPCHKYSVPHPFGT